MKSKIGTMDGLVLEGKLFRALPWNLLFLLCLQWRRSEMSDGNSNRPRRWQLLFHRCSFSTNEVQMAAKGKSPTPCWWWPQLVTSTNWRWITSTKQICARPVCKTLSGIMWTVVLMQITGWTTFLRHSRNFLVRWFRKKQGFTEQMQRLWLARQSKWTEPDNGLPEKANAWKAPSRWRATDKRKDLFRWYGSLSTRYR